MSRHLGGNQSLAPAAGPGLHSAPRLIARRAGFTLIELIVTISIFSILVALAAPSYRSFVLDNRRAAAANDFVAMLNFARATAITLRSPVTVCRSASATAVTPGCETTGSGAGWEDGWFVFVDANGDGVPQNSDATSDTNGDGVIDFADAVLRRHEGLASGALLHGQAASVSDRIIFNSSGIAVTNGALSLCDERGWSKARVIVVSAGGRTQSLDPSVQSSPIAGCL